MGLEQAETIIRRADAGDTEEAFPGQVPFKLPDLGDLDELKIDKGATADLNTRGSSLADAAGGGGTAGDGNVPGLPSAPGTFDGREVTPEHLREFVDSDWRLGFNAWMNTFRDAGAAGIFLNWMASQANRFIGEYEGRIGAQALAGELPRGDFVSFLETKGTGTGESLGGDPNAVAERFTSFTAEEAAADAAGQQEPPAGEEDLGTITPATGDTSGTTLNDLADDPVGELRARS